MLVKESDYRAGDLTVLERLLSDCKDPATRKKIESELAKIRSGIKGEKDAAYHINFRFGASENYAVIHDLRLEVGGHVAQFDHLVIDRFLLIWMCESKRFGEGIAINEHGECAAFYRNRPYGIPSPFEQNNRHSKILNDLWSSGQIELPRRLGFTISPWQRGVVLVSTNARISRARGAEVDGDISKVDQFASLVDREFDKRSSLNAVRLVSSQTLRDFGEKLAALHQPITFDWAARFGLPGKPSSPFRREKGGIDKTLADGAAIPGTPDDRSKLDCATCGTRVPYAVARFCWLNKARFGGVVYCRDHQ